MVVQSAITINIMVRKMENKKLRQEFLQEAILEILRKIKIAMDKLEKNNEISALEILQANVLENYEKLYLAVSNGENIDIEDEKFKNIENKIFEILKKYEISKKEIENNISEKKKNSGKSGAEVVKRLFEYEKKELDKIKYALLDKINIILDKEEKLDLELKNAIQEEEQINIIYKLQPIREEYRKYEEKLIEIQKKIDEVKNKIEKKWYYEIYGNLSEDRMMEIYKERDKDSI